MKCTRSFVFLLFIFLSCSGNDKNFDLSPFDRTLINNYKKGDTLVFETTGNERDSFLVAEIDSSEQRERGYFMAKPAHKEVWIAFRELSIHPKKKKQVGNPSDSIVDDPSYIFTITIYPKQKRTLYTFSFGDFYFSDSIPGMLMHDTVTVAKTVFTDYYLSRDNANDSLPAPIKSLYWKAGNGWMGFQSSDGRNWARK
jgi:hypothetical protein